MAILNEIQVGMNHTIVESWEIALTCSGIYPKTAVCRITRPACIKEFTQGNVVTAMAAIHQRVCPG